jgi:hypothetical protein
MVRRDGKGGRDRLGDAIDLFLLTNLPKILTTSHLPVIDSKDSSRLLAFHVTGRRLRLQFGLALRSLPTVTTVGGKANSTLITTFVVADGPRSVLDWALLSSQITPTAAHMKFRQGWSSSLGL